MWSLCSASAWPPVTAARTRATAGTRVAQRRRMWIPAGIEQREASRWVQRTCATCKVTAQALAVVRWEVGMTAAIPMWTRNARTVWRCSACGSPGMQRGGLPGLPPRGDRLGVTVIVAAAVLFAAFTTVRIVRAERARDARDAVVADARPRIQAAVRRYESKVAACEARWRATIARAFPRGLLEENEIENVDQATHYDAPLVALRPATTTTTVLGLLAREENSHQPLCRDSWAPRMRDVAAGYDPPLDAESATRRAEQLETVADELAPTTRVIVIDSACAKKTCTVAAAVLDADGRVRALARRKGPKLTYELVRGAMYRLTPEGWSAK